MWGIWRKIRISENTFIARVWIQNSSNFFNKGSIDLWKLEIFTFGRNSKSERWTKFKSLVNNCLIHFDFPISPFPNWPTDRSTNWLTDWLTDWLTCPVDPRRANPAVVDLLPHDSVEDLLLLQSDWNLTKLEIIWLLFATKNSYNWQT